MPRPRRRRGGPSRVPPYALGGLALSLASAAPGAAAAGNPACWGGGFSYETCCAPGYGPEGNKACWDEAHTRATCCVAVDAGSEAQGLDELLQLGEGGDASVLPKLMQLLVHGGPLACEPLQPEYAAAAPALRCAGGGRGPSAAAWQAFFRAMAATKLMRAGKWPEEADPWTLVSRCCLGEDAAEVLAEMQADCAFGTVALLLSASASVEEHAGTERARTLYQRAEGIRSRHWHLQGFDCPWVQQVNHDLFRHVGWFLGAAVPSGDAGAAGAAGASGSAGRLPCPAGGPRIFVDERPALRGLSAAPLACGRRGLCFTEVWIHQYLKYSACRVDSAAEADVVYVPIYSSCHGLDRPSEGQREALRQLYQLGAEVGPPLLLVFTCEVWKLEGWEEALRRRSILAVVESRPLLRGGAPAAAPPAAAPAAPPPDGASAQRPWVSHCTNCFYKDVDIVVPSAVPPADAARLRSFSKEPQDRQLLLCFHGEHAGTETRGDVAEGYREVNETVRIELLSRLKGRPETSVGGPTMAYSFIMGNCHFCLAPRGRGWWTVRLYEAFYAGCIPVLLSDHYEVPFSSFLEWSEFSLKWPMRHIGDQLYEHLRQLVAERWPLVEALHRRVREVACWFDFHAPASANCSPYLGLMTELAQRRIAWGEAAARQDSLSPQSAQLPLAKYWF